MNIDINILYPALIVVIVLGLGIAAFVASKNEANEEDSADFKQRSDFAEDDVLAIDENALIVDEKVDDRHKIYYLIVNGGRKGPYTAAQAIKLFKDKEISEKTKVWCSEFGPDWKDFNEVEAFMSSSTVPLVPASEISSKWVWSLVFVPFFGLTGLFPDIKAVVGATNFITFGMIALNFYFTKQDHKAIIRSGRRDLALDAGQMWLGIVFIPVYIFIRSKKFGNWFPFFGWLMSASVSIWLLVSLPGLVYFGTGLPRCNAPISVSKVKEMFVDLPINFSKARALDVAAIYEVSASGAERVCKASIVASTGTNLNVKYTISERDGNYWFLLNLDF